MKPFSNRRGQALLASIVVMGAVALIYIVAVVIKSQSIQKSSLLSRKSISAYEVANACVQKGIWALNLNSDNWAAAGHGTVISGYDGNTIYSDIAGGKYKLSIIPGPGTDDRTITCYAKDDSASPEYRGLEVVLSKGSAQFGAVMGYKIKFQKKTNIHWGPVYAYDDLDIKEKSRVFYPRLFSKGKIKHIDNKASLPNTDGIFWWSFNYSPGVPAWPNVDLEYYKALAKAQGTYYKKGDRSEHKKHKDDDSDKIDEHDRSDEDSYSYSNVIDTQPYVRFYDTGVKAKFKGGNNLLRGAIIAMDTLEFKDGTASIASVNAKYSSLGLSAFYPRAVSVPADAWKEYKKIDTSSPETTPEISEAPAAREETLRILSGPPRPATSRPAPLFILKGGSMPERNLN